jgi:hypothetical protein
MSSELPYDSSLFLSRYRLFFDMEGSKSLSVETTLCSAELKYYLHPAQAVLTLNAK